MNNITQRRHKSLSFHLRYLVRQLAVVADGGEERDHGLDEDEGVPGGDPDLAEVAGVGVEAEGVPDGGVPGGEGGAGHRGAAPPLPLHGGDEAGPHLVTQVLHVHLHSCRGESVSLVTL